MPNWVINKMKISSEYTPQILNDEGKVDFNKVIPMPTSLNCESGSITDIAIYAYLSNSNAIDLYDMKKNELANKMLASQFHGTEARIEMIYNSYRQWIDGRPDLKDDLYKKGENYVHNFLNYGCPTWYEWSIRNWGCKWNASNCKVSPADSENMVYIEFTSPWSPPEGVLKALYEKGIPFYLEWIEESGYHGEFISDGKILLMHDLENVENFPLQL